jgi:hypothetical protein
LSRKIVAGTSKRPPVDLSRNKSIQAFFVFSNWQRPFQSAPPALDRRFITPRDSLDKIKIGLFYF